MPQTDKPFLNRSRIAGFIIVAWLFVVSVLSFSDHAALSELYRQSDRTDEQAMVEALQIHIAQLTGQVADVSNRVDEQRYSTDVDEKLLSLEQAFVLMQERYQQSPDVGEAVHEVMNRLDQMDAQIKLLQQAQKAAPPAPINPVKKDTQTQGSYSEPEFILLGVELRGSQQLLSVAPKGSRNIGDIKLIQPGDMVGMWQLESFDNTQATFTSHGRSKTFPIPKGTL
ncbi:hypothetical protein [Saezia sanguinis]|uniref:hypothetical protein n=1 Tax=Saezia sanguinis TaxID=1965230 RepID=UPI003067A8AC